MNSVSVVVRKDIAKVVAKSLTSDDAYLASVLALYKVSDLYHFVSNGSRLSV